MPACEVCEFIVVNGYLPPDVKAHCSGDDGCHRTWSGRSEEHCAAGCHRHFGGDAAFVAHRKGGVCTDPSRLKTKDGAPRFKVVMRKDGATWVTDDARDTLARTEKVRKVKGANRERPSRSVAATTQRRHRLTVPWTDHVQMILFIQEPPPRARQRGR